MRARRRNGASSMRGAALLIAMLFAALAAVVTVGLASGQERWRAIVEQRRDQVQAVALAQAGVQWARRSLAVDANAVTSLDQPWALPLPRTPLDNGSIEGRIVDAQGLINLNNLAGKEATAPEEKRRAAALFAALGIPASALDAIIGAIDSDTAARADGDHDAYYLAARPPRLAPRQALLRLAEFSDVRELDAARIAALSSVATALPPTTTLNVNTAPPAVLAAALPGLANDEMLASFVAERARRAFASLADLRSRLPQGVTIPDERTLGVGSVHFLVDVTARQGATEARARALVHRTLDRQTRVLGQVIE
jgi:general secretion pathway protein K